MVEFKKGDRVKLKKYPMDESIPYFMNGYEERYYDKPLIITRLCENKGPILYEVYEEGTVSSEYSYEHIFTEIKVFDKEAKKYNTVPITADMLEKISKYNDDEIDKFIEIYEDLEKNGIVKMDDLAQIKMKMKALLY
jgi:hypothetical protein